MKKMILLYKNQTSIKGQNTIKMSFQTSIRVTIACLMQKNIERSTLKRLIPTILTRDCFLMGIKMSLKKSNKENIMIPTTIWKKKISELSIV